MLMPPDIFRSKRTEDARNIEWSADEVLERFAVEPLVLLESSGGAEDVRDKK
jgi:hypothetical protein